MSGTGIEVVPNLPRCRVPVLSLCRENTRAPGIAVESTTVSGVYLSGRTELTEVWGTGIDFVPNLTGVFGRVLRAYRTLPEASAGYFPTK